MSVRDQIREHTRLARMRSGQDVPEYVDIPSMPGVRIAMVPLTEAQVTSNATEVARKSAELPNNLSGASLLDRIGIQLDLWQSCREVENPEVRVWETVDEMVKELEPSDIDFLSLELGRLMIFASPQLGLLSDKDIDDLKNGCALLPWRELTGTQAAVALIFLSRIFPAVLQDRSPGSGSTD